MTVSATGVTTDIPIARNCLPGRLTSYVGDKNAADPVEAMAHITRRRPILLNPERSAEDFY
ncbi:hypothetical protein [Cutibacterium sp.]|uniref:hypothetical protein n=1 Tax=Cutibacterium sp. TaxID=1912221 RepID=UPI0026DBC970|nr:hypothetical protein [Cutibacterium sp.]MDO4412310.1 hypothetical protein [Cutibacterium sp.]